MTQKNDEPLKTEQLMPWETAEDLSPDAAHQAVLDDLDSEDDEEQPTPSEPAADEADDEEDFEEDDAPEGVEAEEPEPEDAEEPEEDDSEEPEDDEADDSADEEEPTYYPVTIDGVEYEVTLEEALAGYSRTQDYTRKSQAREEEYRGKLAEAREERDKYGKRLEVLEAAIQEAVPHAGRPAEEWDKLRQENPDKFAREFAEAQLAQQKLQAVQAQKQQILKEQHAEWEAKREERLAAEKKALMEAIPEWKDPEVSKRERGELLRFATDDLGYTEQELAAVEDHRLMLVLRDAMRYRKGQAKGKAAIREKVKAAPKLKPGAAKKRSSEATARKRRIRKAREELARTGSEKAAEALIFESLDD